MCDSQPRDLKDIYLNEGVPAVICTTQNELAANTADFYAIIIYCILLSFIIYTKKGKEENKLREREAVVVDTTYTKIEIYSRDT